MSRGPRLPPLRRTHCLKKEKKCPDGRTTVTDRLPPTDERGKTFFFVRVYPSDVSVSRNLKRIHN